MLITKPYYIILCQLTVQVNHVVHVICFQRYHLKKHDIMDKTSQIFIFFLITFSILNNHVSDKVSSCNYG